MKTTTVIVPPPPKYGAAKRRRMFLQVFYSHFLEKNGVCSATHSLNRTHSAHERVCLQKRRREAAPIFFYPFFGFFQYLVIVPRASCCAGGHNNPEQGLNANKMHNLNFEVSNRGTGCPIVAPEMHRNCWGSNGA